MNYIVLLSAVLGCAMARPQVLQLAPLSQLETSASALAAASASSSQPQLSLLQLLQRAPLSADGRVLDTLEVRLAKAEHEAAHQRARANLVNARALGLAAPLTSSSVSAQSSASASSSRTPSPLTVNTLENDLVRAALGLERREPLRLTNESVQRVPLDLLVEDDLIRLINDQPLSKGASNVEKNIEDLLRIRSLNKRCTCG
ncbi:uncharacterized protein LOC106652617 isoform X2 [Trichogramma pretiosum]|uniref:uncharacterized protein LOC106652617 isoform X2 n=1 Tax=Trichogramma pretiosum TaxID=7493 RepID=UPI0006C94B85|nr:uncharacterized protein LOC106652617 isoform X2 [Trichogramma pretiosum]